jgi:DNA-binding XRE family transcriptional regulator
MCKIPANGVSLTQNARAARQHIDISQQTLGVRVGFSRGDVVVFEQGKRNFRTFTAVKLAGRSKQTLPGCSRTREAGTRDR